MAKQAIVEQSLVEALSQSGVDHGSQDYADYERGKAIVGDWRLARWLDRQERLSYEQAIAVVAEYVGV